MEITNSILDRYENKKNEAPKHELAASVNEIIKVLGETPMYNYGYWLRKVGSASYSQVLEILKECSNLENKYSKGGFITNQLKKYAIPNAKPKRPRANRRGTDSDKKGDGTGQVGNTGIREVDDSKERVQRKPGRPAKS